MEFNPRPRFSDLRKGRVSVKYARYFVTLCTRERARVLCDESIMGAIRGAWREAHDCGDALTRAGVVMPDHIHWVFQLGDRLTLTRVMAKFKSRTRAALAKHGTHWETNYWEHRLRPEDCIEAFGAYILMNPYRAGLAAPGESWPHGWWPEDYGFEFSQHLGPDGVPPMSWTGEYKRPAGWRREASP